MVFLSRHQLRLKIIVNKNIVSHQANNVLRQSVRAILYKLRFIDYVLTDKCATIILNNTQISSSTMCKYSFDLWWQASDSFYGFLDLISIVKVWNMSAYVIVAREAIWSSSVSGRCMRARSVARHSYNITVQYKYRTMRKKPYWNFKEDQPSTLINHSEMTFQQRPLHIIIVTNHTLYCTLYSCCTIHQRHVSVKIVGFFFLFLSCIMNGVECIWQRHTSNWGASTIRLCYLYDFFYYYLSFYFLMIFG